MIGENLRRAKMKRKKSAAAIIKRIKIAKIVNFFLKQNDDKFYG